MRILAIDLGERRIGLALSDPSGTLARPWRVITVGGGLDETVDRLAREIAALAREDDGLERIVIGLPRRLDGTPNEQTARTLAAADALGARTTVPVAFQDERLTSREAEARLALRERDWRKRKLRLDAAAAAVILQDYLDQHAPPPVR